MPRKKKKDNSKFNEEDEIIIGYNSKKQKDKPSKTKKKKVKKKTTKTKEQNIKSKKPKKKQKKKNGALRKILKILLRLIIVVTIGAGIILFLFVSPVFNIQEITVEGAKEISESAYIAMSGIEVGENIFEIDKTSAIAEIKKEPYVGTVQINTIYPKKIEIKVEERTISYVVEQNNKYYYIDKNGYILEESLSALDFVAIKGYTSNLEEIGIGSRLGDKDLSKFNDIIKITDAIQNNNIVAKLTTIDITYENNYILEFKAENKIIILGDATDLSAKMTWIKLFIEEKKNEKGTIHLNTENVYFSPNT